MQEFNIHRFLDLLRSDSLILHIQQIRSLESLRKPYYEVLLRIRDGNKDSSAERLIEVAEVEGWIELIDREVIRSTFAFINENNSGFAYSINLSGDTISRDDTLVPFITKLTKEFDISPQNICFEITERSRLSSSGAARNRLNQLRKLGYSIALDDFGRGYLDFDLLQTLRPEFVKIDGTFVRELASTDQEKASYAHAVCAGITEICRTLNIKTVAEYVETEQVFEKVAALKIDYAQGWFIHRPESIADNGGERIKFRKQL